MPAFCEGAVGAMLWQCFFSSAGAATVLAACPLLLLPCLGCVCCLGCGRLSWPPNRCLSYPLVISLRLPSGSPQMDKVASQLRNNNQRLKGLVHKMANTRNFCVDIILLCLLLGIGAYLYSMFAPK